MSERHRGEATDVVATFRDWEARHPVDEWDLFGIPLWPLLRVSLGFRMLAATQILPGAKPAQRRFAGARGRVRNAVRARSDRGASIRSVPRADVLFLSYPTNRQALNGRFVDRFFDPMADALEAHGIGTLQLEHRQDATDYRVPRARPSLLLRPAVERIGRARDRDPRPVAGRVDGVEALREEIGAAQEGELRPWKPPTLRALARLMQWIDMLAEHFDDVLARARPRLVLCTYYYGTVAMALGLAASRRGIPFVDVQHGVTVGNPAYDGWTRFPAAGYSLLPDYFWCWSEADRAPTARWPEPARNRHPSFVGGHPWEAFWGSELPVVASERVRVRALVGATRTVLVTLSWSSALSDALKAILRDAPSDWTFWIRLHPTMDGAAPAIRDWCRAHAAARCHITDPTQLPLPLLLREADVHLTHTSTVIQEAAAAGLPSVALGERAAEMYPDAFVAGWVSFPGPDGAVAALAARSRGAAAPVAAGYPDLDHLTATLMALLEGRLPGA